MRYTDLRVGFRQDGQIVEAVKGVSFSVEKGETVALVGESGSGKSVTALSSVNLLPDTAQMSGSITYEDQELVGASEKQLRKLRGNDISFIFQEPMTSLNPLHTLEKQLAEVLLIHHGMTGSTAQARVIELLEQVGIHDPESRLKDYPHQLSGGQRQRVMIAMALANNPELLIADEPTTALDVTIQAQILELLRELKSRLGMSMLFITHDLNIVRKIADRVCVMKDGEIVETGPTAEIFASPQHPYTQMLLAAEATGRPAPVPEGAEVVAETKDLRVWFPVPTRAFAQNRGLCQSRERRDIFRSCGRNRWHRRRIRIGKNHAGAGDDAPDFLKRPGDGFGPRYPRPVQSTNSPNALRYADRVPRSFWLSVSTYDRGSNHCRRSERTHRRGL